MRRNFYVIEFSCNGVTQTTMPFCKITSARKAASWYAGKKYFENVRIMKGGPGGVEVK